MRIIKPNWYGLDHDAVNKKFEGNLSFVNDFCVNGEYQPSAIYRAEKPNKDKGHKKYMLITKTPQGFVVRGMSSQKIAQFRYQTAVHCLECDDVVYSINRHDFRSCSCGSSSIDGGQDYYKVSFKTGTSHKLVRIDLLTDSISDITTGNGDNNDNDKVSKRDRSDKKVRKSRSSSSKRTKRVS